MFFSYFAYFITVIISKEVFAITQKSLSDQNIRIAAEWWDPFLSIGEDTEGHAIYGGVMWELVKFMQRARNFTFEIYRPSDGEWGGCNENNECTGMIGMVSRNEVDFALGKEGNRSIKYIRIMRSARPWMGSQ